MHRVKLNKVYVAYFTPKSVLKQIMRVSNSRYGSNYREQTQKPNTQIIIQIHQYFAHCIMSILEKRCNVYLNVW